MEKTVPKCTVADVESLIERYSGNVAAIARHLDCSRGTIWNRIHEGPHLEQMLADARKDERSGLRQYRVQADLTQTELAQRLGVRQSTVSQWENGISIPSAMRFVQLANVLDVPVSDLLESIVQ